MRDRPASSVSLILSQGCITEAELHSGRRNADAVEFIVFRHGYLVAELRALAKRCQQLDGEGRALDERLEALQRACKAILAL